jgi:2-hydroxychromene-2-carboxylate isomerase
MANPFSVDLYWSFRSPYSYLALRRVRQWAADYPIRWNVRIVWPLAVRKPEHFARLDPLHRPYFKRDCARVAEQFGIPFRWPVPDPIVQDPVTLSIAKDQPYIRRVTLLGAAAALRGKALPYIDEVSQLIWDGRTDNWHQGDHLKQAAARAGLDHDEMQRAIDKDPAACERWIEDNQRDQRASGHWGVPLFVFEGEPFFGQDRMDALLWRMTQKGLQKS